MGQITKFMAKILPFRAWRYNRILGKAIGELTSPLFDVISPKQREALYKNRYNSIHLSIPLQGTLGNETGSTIETWKAAGVLEQDPIPGIYVYYQHFSLPGSTKKYIRKGFVSFIEATDWGNPNADILQHENTIPHAVSNRINVLRATKLNVSPTHGLYFDSDFALEKYMDESMCNPIYDTEDYQGVRNVLSVIHDRNIIRQFVTRLAKEKVILADGHHRLESSIKYRKQQLELNRPETGQPAGFNYHMMYLTNGASDGLSILPTHRLISGLAHFDSEAFLKKLAAYFIIKPLENPNDISEIILGKKWTFGLLFGDQAVELRLKPEVHKQLSWHFPNLIKSLDLTVMHYFIIEKGVGIAGRDQRKSRHISFERNFANCLKKTIKGEAQFAIITQGIDMETVKEVCHSGHTLPQKSTYFYPKVSCGYLFGSIKHDEFEIPFNPGF